MMPEVTDPNLLAQLNGGAARPQAGTPSLRQVVGPQPKTVSPIEGGRYQMDEIRFQQEQEDRAKKQEEEARAAEASKVADEQARQKLLRVIGTMNQVGLDASDNTILPEGTFQTGASGNVARFLLPKGTAGHDLADNVKTLRANYAFDALQAMRDASKTGGALGQVSEIELQLLESAVTNIDPSQSHEQFMRNLENARQAYLSKLMFTDPETAQRMGYDPEKAETAWIELNDEYNKKFGLDTPKPAFERKAQAEPGGEWKVERID